MLERLSENYYMAQLDVVEMGVEYAEMHPKDHMEICEEIYEVNSPLLMKIEKNHIPVYTAGNVPNETVVVPKDLDIGTERGRTVKIADEDTMKYFFNHWGLI